MSTTDQQFKPGEIVAFTAGGSYHHYRVFARVARVTPKGTVFAQPLEPGRDEKEFRGGRGLERPSVHAIAMREWNLQRPETKYLEVYASSSTIGRPYHGYYQADEHRVGTRANGHRQ